MMLDYDQIATTLAVTGIIAIVSIAWKSYQKLNEIGFSIKTAFDKLEEHSGKVEQNESRINDHEIRIVRVETALRLEDNRAQN